LRAPTPEEVARARSFWKKNLSLSIALADERVHACTGCAARSFGVTAPCALCQAPTVGPDLDRAASGADAAACRAAATRAKVMRATLWVVGAVWAMVVLRILVAWTQTAIGAFVVGVVWILGGAVLTIGALVIGRKLIDAALPADVPVKDAGSLANVDEKLIVPFLARNGGKVSGLPAEEVSLFTQALAGEGHTLDPGSITALLVSSTLRRDLKRLGDQLLARAPADAAGARRAMLEAFVLAFPEVGAEGAARPLLRHLLHERGLNAAHELLFPELDELRRELKLKGFLTDLEQRRKGGLSLSLETVDGLSGDAFTGLLEMIHESLGWHVTRDGGAVVLEKLGERAVLGVHSQVGNVDEAPVRALVSVRERVGSKQAIFATNGTLTPAAQKAADAGGVQVIDRSGLRSLITSFERSPKDHDRLEKLLKPR
jgi:hypothetical protein